MKTQPILKVVTTSNIPRIVDFSKDMQDMIYYALYARMLELKKKQEEGEGS